MAEQYPVDPEKMRHMEQAARMLGKLIELLGDKAMGEHTGFALFLFSFGEHGELTYISNSSRADMIKMLHEFLATNSPPLTWDEQHG
jgi:hypothetical protein